MRLLIVVMVLSFVACSNNNELKTESAPKEIIQDLVAVLDTIWITEQTPIRLRDSIMKEHGAESMEFKKLEKVVHKNHFINEKKVRAILDKYGWPGEAIVGAQGSLTICNVLQHSSNQIRVKYLPMMKKAVKDKKLQPRLLARAEDRLATDRDELQIYGGQIKYYPITKSFNVWPIIDPANVDKRRTEIGLEPIADFLKGRRFPVEWNLEEQLKRTAAFEEEGINEG